MTFQLLLFVFSGLVDQNVLKGKEEKSAQVSSIGSFCQGFALDFPAFPFTRHLPLSKPFVPVYFHVIKSSSPNLSSLLVIHNRQKLNVLLSLVIFVF